MKNENENRVSYEKPDMKFVELRSKNEVANTCWGYASNGTGGDLYYNSPGYGWVNFSVSGSDCKTSSKLTYTVKGYKDGMTDEQKAAANIAMGEFWDTKASNGGSPFKGGSDYSESEPSNWS